jgi:threonine synthase
MQNNFENLKHRLSSYSYDDAVTASTIQRVYKTNNYILDPHGAVAFLAAEQFIQDQDNVNGNHVASSNPSNSIRAIILETAHPVKFPEVVEEAIGEKIVIPDSVKFLLDKEKVSIPMGASFEGFKAWMLSKIGA